MAEWLKSILDIKRSLRSDNTHVISAYKNIINTVYTDKNYTERAKAQFASCADSWLIAHAFAKKYTIVTLEKFDPAIKRKVKIPNVCKNFNIRYTDLFNFMRSVNLTL